MSTPCASVRFLILRNQHSTYLWHGDLLDRVVPCVSPHVLEALPQRLVGRLVAVLGLRHQVVHEPAGGAPFNTSHNHHLANSNEAGASRAPWITCFWFATSTKNKSLISRYKGTCLIWPDHTTGCTGRSPTWVGFTRIRTVRPSCLSYRIAAHQAGQLPKWIQLRDLQGHPVEGTIFEFFWCCNVYWKASLDPCRTATTSPTPLPIFWISSTRPNFSLCKIHSELLLDHYSWYHL